MTNSPNKSAVFDEISASAQKASSQFTAFSENQRPPEASRYTGVSESKLAKLRMARYRHLGPKFIRAAGCIIYRKADLDEWLASHLIETSHGEGA